MIGQVPSVTDGTAPAWSTLFQMLNINRALFMLSVLVNFSFNQWDGILIPFTK